MENLENVSMIADLGKAVKLSLHLWLFGLCLERPFLLQDYFEKKSAFILSQMFCYLGLLYCAISNPPGIYWCINCMVIIGYRIFDLFCNQQKLKLTVTSAHGKNKLLTSYIQKNKICLTNFYL